MLEIVLVQPEIPPNAGNVIRLAANTGARLHLVKPLGFSMDHRQLKRAGLDYHDMANVTVHRAWKEFLKEMAERRKFAFTTKAKRIYSEAQYAAGDVLVFGPETSGLPDSILEEFKPDMQLRLPMRTGNRSLNLSNAVAVVVYEAWRQLGFPGGA
jgi:tRNA (cytidine/uridine-2'-O-)-methyltransferase